MQHNEDTLMVGVSSRSKSTRIRYGTLWGSMVVALFFFVLFFEAFTLSPRNSIEFGVLFSFAINGVMGLLSLLQAIRKHSYSLASMHWIFYLLFFVFSPVIQYIFGSFPWAYQHNNNALIQGNCLLTAWAVLVLAMQYFRLHRTRRYSQRISAIEASDSIPIIVLNILLIVSGLITVYLITTIGFINLFARVTNELTFDSSSLRQIVEKATRATVTFTLLASIIRFKSKHDCIFQLIFALIFCLISCFPTGMPRYSAAVIWGSIALVSLPVFRRNRILFPLLFCLSFLIVFPSINVYKGSDFSSGDMFATTVAVVQNFFDTFVEVSYDAYSMFLRTIDYTNQCGVTYGYQLLGALLFFVPRSIWSTKPFGSGATVAACQGQRVTNVSCPLPAEAIINFGVVGLIIAAIFIGWLIRRIDDAYWRDDNLSLFVTIAYPQLLFFFFFMLRGDLLSTFAYTIAFIFTDLVLASICKSVTCHERTGLGKKSVAGPSRL